MYRWSVLLLLLIVPVGCKMGPDYARPDVSSGDSWRMAAAASESIANLSWWELLKDKELQNVMQIALTENQDVRTAMASVDQYRAQLVMTKWDLAPSLSYGASAFIFFCSRSAARSV